MKQGTLNQKVDAAGRQKVAELLRAKTPTWQIDKWLTETYGLGWREAMNLRREIAAELEKPAAPAEVKPEPPKEEFPF